MNDILWLLYAADLVSGLTWTGILLICASVVGLVICAISASDAHPNEGWESPARKAKKFATVAVVLLFATAALPSTTTIYAAAALSAGNQVSQTEIGKKALAALENWLDKQTNEKGN